MLGKNNFKERLRKMEMQAKRDRFSIRNLSVGAASVLLGFAFFGLDGHSVKADAVNPSTPVDGVKSTTTASPNEDATGAVQSSAKRIAKKKVKLMTYSELQAFLKSDSDDNTAVKPAGDQEASAKGDVVGREADGNATASQPATGPSAANNSGSEGTGEELSAPSIAGTEQSDSHSEKTPALVAKTAASVAQVTNWDELKAAYLDASVNEIDVMNDIAATADNRETSFYVKNRKLIIKSGGDGSTRYTINFKGNHPSMGPNGSLDLTYENLSLWSADWYGVIWTGGIDNGSDRQAQVTFRNIDFHGSQLIYCSNQTHIKFEGTNSAETVAIPYPGTTVSFTNNQQLFQFTGSNNSIEFNGKFTGTTYAGNVIEMAGSNNTITVAKGATVTLNPAGNLSTNLGFNPGENTATMFAIYMGGTGQKINVGGTLNINVGQADYAGTYDYKQASGIYMASGTPVSDFTIDSNAAVNIKTNGDIANYGGRRNLVYIGGNFYIRPKGGLNITGQDMGNYSDTMVMVTGTADIENGSFNVQLKDGVGTGAGTGAITLVDVTGGTITINNPTSLILDASRNKNANTSIIGNNAITVTNVRQVFDDIIDPTTSRPLMMPPFHKLMVHRDASTGKIVLDPNTASPLVLLNGKKKLDKIPSDPAITALLSKYPALGSLLAGSVGQSYDNIFKKVIELAFSDSSPSNPGYNHIHLIPANPSGFLDIDPASVNVVAEDDGSRTITGKVVNYAPATDGPGSDGVFGKLLPGGTNAYIIAKYKGSKNGQAWTNPQIKALPYANTDDASLQSAFAAKVNDDGTFSFTIPAGEVAKLAKGDQIALTPEANFVGYDKNESDRPLIKDLNVVTVDDARDAAAKAINDAIADAQDKKPTTLTPEESQAFDDAMSTAAAIAANPGKKDESVYGADTTQEVAVRKQKALQVVKDALAAAQASGKLQAAKNDAIAKLTTEAAKQAASYPAQRDAINAARDQAINSVKADATTAANLDDVTSQGMAAIDQVAVDYKDGIKKDITDQITAVESAIDAAASDANLHQAEKDAITALKTGADLNSARDIAKDKGAIDTDDHEGAASETVSVEGHKKTANDSIARVKATIDAIKKLQDAASEQIKNHGDDKDSIQDALNKGVDDILNGSDPDGSNGTAAINNVHSTKQKERAVSDVHAAAKAARDRVENSGLDATKQNEYLAAIDLAEKNATAKPGDSGYDQDKSIYGTDDDQEIKDLRVRAQNAFDKTATKAEVEGNAKSYLDGLGLTSNAEIDQAVKDGLAAIDQITDAATPAPDNAAAIADAAKTAKSNILAAAQAETKKQIQADADAAKGMLGGSADQAIDDAVAAINKVIDGHTSPTDLKQDIAAGKDNLLAAYKKAAKAQIAAIGAADKEALGVTADANIDQAIDAATELVDAAESITGVNNDLTKGKDKILKAFKAAAKKQVQDTADAVKGYLGVSADQTIDVAVAAAGSAIDGHLDAADIKQDIAEGKSSIISAYQKEATSALQNKQSSVKDQIDRLTDIADAVKSDLKAKVDAEYQAAADNVAKTQTPDDIDAAQKNGIKKMDDVLAEATGLNQAITDNQKKLDDAAQAAVNQINKTDMTDADKQQAISAINAARDTAKINVGLADAVDVAKAAEAKGEEVIMGAVDKASQADLKNAKKAKAAEVEQVAAEAKQKIDDAYNKLTDAEKATAKADYDQAIKAIDDAATAAKTAIDSAQDKAGAVAAAKTATGAINGAVSTAETAFEKVAAKDAVQAEADRIKASLTKPEDQQKVDDLASQANDAIDAATSVTAVDQVRDKAIADIDNVKSTADATAAKDLQAAKDKAISALHDEQVKVKGTIDGLPNISDDVKAALKAKVDAEYDTAARNVTDAQTSDAVTEATAAGIKKIDEVLTEARGLNEAIAEDKQKVEDAANAAKDKINNSNMSDADKSAAIDAINQAASEAKTEVGKADTIQKADDAATAGVTDINNAVSQADEKDLKQVKANSKINIDSAAIAAKKQVNDAYNKLTDAEKATAKADYDQAVKAIDDAAAKAKTAIDSAQDKAAAVAVAKTATGAINGAVSTAETAFEKVAAKDAVQAEATKIKAGLSNPADQKAVDDLVTEANKDIDAAANVVDVDQARDKAIADIDNVKSTADATAAKDLQAAKDKAISALHDEQIKIKGTIDGLPNISDDVKTALKAKVDAEYDTDAKNVTDAQTTADITAAKEDGIKKIDEVLTEARGLNEAIAKDKQKVEDAANAAKDEIAKSDMSDADKSAAIDAINTAAESAKDNVGKADTIQKADDAAQSGIEAVTEAQNNANQADLKNAKKAKAAEIEQAAADAKKQVDDAYNKLTDAEKATAKADYDQAVKAIDDAAAKAKTAIDQAQDKAAAAAAAKTATGAINGAVSTAETAFEKLTAKDAVQAEATKIKAGLSNPADQKAVDDLVTEANKDIDAATSVAAVDQIRDKAIADIDSVKTAADDTAVKGLKDAQAKALNELHDEQVKVKGTIDGLPNISDSAKIALKAKVDAAYKTAADKVEAAQTLSDVDTAKTNGLKAMDDVLNEAKDLSATIAADQKKLDDAAQAAVDRINKSDMADEDKQKAIGAITAARNAAKENVGKQTTETAANDATTAGEAAITAAETTANQADLDEAKTANKAALDEAVKAAKGRLTAAYNKLPPDERATVKDDYDHALAAIDRTAKAAKATIDQATDKATIRQTVEKANNDITTVETGAETAFEKTAARDAVKAEANKIKAGLNKQEDKDKVDALSAQANKDIDAAAGVAAVDQARDKAIQAIDNVKSTADATVAKDLQDAKNQAIGELHDKQVSVKGTIDGLPNISSDVKTKLKAKVDAEYQAAATGVANAQTLGDVTNAKTSGLEKMDAVLTEAKGLNASHAASGGGGMIVVPAPDKDDNKPNHTQPAATAHKVKNVVLMHNAYLYDETGKCANKITLKAGSSLVTYGTEVLNGRQYYVLVDQGADNKKYYVAIGNAEAIKQPLKHNAYVYNKYGKRIKRLGTLHKGAMVNTYGAPVKIRGHKYFITANNRFIKAANVDLIASKAMGAGVVEPISAITSAKPVATVEKRIMHNAYLYNEKGERSNGLIIAAGSAVNTTGTRAINGRAYYALENGTYIATGNVDGQNLRLRHNAYIYSQYGNRLGRQVLKRHRSLKVYGDPVTIKGRKYYTVAKNMYVKTANFR